MIKKILVVTIAILLVIVPNINADETPAPTEQPTHTPYIAASPCISPVYVNSGLIQTDFEILSTEIEIGGEIYFKVSLTNMTDDIASIYSIYISGLSGCDMESMDNSQVPDYGNQCIINSGETVEFKLKGLVKDGSFTGWSCYKDGDEFYANYSMSVGVYVFDTYYQCWNYDFPTVKVTNIYDGSEYIDYEWIDDRGKMYFYDTESYNYIYKPESKEFVSYMEMQNAGFAYYYIKWENISDETIHMYERYESDTSSSLLDYDLHPGDSKMINGCNKKYCDYGEVEDVIESEYMFRFTKDGKHYAVNAKREYESVMIKKPTVDIEINSIEKDGPQKYYYEFLITNIGEEPLENLLVRTNPDANNSDINDLNPGETIRYEDGYFYEHNYKKLMVGYLLDGHMFMWWTRDLLEYDARSILGKEPALELGENWTRYENVKQIGYYYIQGENGEEKVQTGIHRATTMSPAPTVSPTLTPTTTPMPTQNIENSDSEESKLWIVIVSILIIAVLAWTAIVVVKKHKKNEDRK